MRKIIIAACTLSLTASMWAADPDADNTGKNERDRSAKTVTSGDQSESKEDIDISAAIRRSVVKDTDLSMMAKNIKIITINGAVTLRGPVKTEEEKKKIEVYAKNGGAKTIDNQLEIKTRN